MSINSDEILLRLPKTRLLILIDKAKTFWPLRVAGAPEQMEIKKNEKKSE
jgi:hypothetical protein